MKEKGSHVPIGVLGLLSDVMLRPTHERNEDVRYHGEAKHHQLTTDDSVSGEFWVSGDYVGVHNRFRW